MLGSLLGGAMNLTSNLIGRSSNASEIAAQRQYNYAAALQQNAQDFTERMYKNRFQYQRTDMENAGINPLSMFGTNPSSPAGSASSVGMGTDAAEKLGIKDNYLKGLTVGRDLAVGGAQARLMNAQAKTESINTGLVAMEKINRMIDAVRNKKDLDNYDTLFEYNLKKLESEIESNLTASMGNRATAYDATTRAANTEEQTKKLRRINKTIEGSAILQGMEAGYSAAGEKGSYVGAGIGAKSITDKIDKNLGSTYIRKGGTRKGQLYQLNVRGKFK